MTPADRLALLRPTVAILSAALAACSISSSSATDGGLSGDGATADSVAPGDDSSDGSNEADAAPLDDFAWVKSFDAGFGSSILAMASDGTSVVIAGQITGSATFGTTTLTGPTSAGNAFVAKLDTSGTVLWAQIASGASSDFEAVALDATGNVIVSGTDFGDGPSITFGGSTLAPDTTGMIGGNPVATSAGVLIEMGPTGAVKWSKLVESTGEVNLGSLALSGSTIFAAGPIIDDAAFASGGGMPITGCGTAGCVYLAAWAADGTIQWAKVAPSTPHRGTGADPREVWLAANTTSLALAIGGDQEAAAGGTDAAQVVVNEYDLTGALTWSRSTPLANGGPAVTGVALDAAGNAFVSGEFGDGLVFGSVTVTGGQYVVSYSPTGNVAWAIDDPSGGVLGIHGLALGSTLYTFGNGELGPEPDGGTSMSLDGFDPATGKIVSVDPCSATMGIGQTVTASSAGVFVAGQGGAPGHFGKYPVTQQGLFVARKK
jgi:hypothetical protein